MFLFKKKLSHVSCLVSPNERGQMLVEAMVSITIIIFALLGGLALLTNALGINRMVADRFTAAYLAGEGIEITRNILDSNYVQGQVWNYGDFDKNWCYEMDYNTLCLTPIGSCSVLNSATRVTPCNDNKGSTRALNLDSNGYYSYGFGSPTKFYRTISISKLLDSVSNQYGVHVISTVDWATRIFSTDSVSVEDYFYHWRLP